MSDTPKAPATPPPLTVAASLVALQGVVLIGLGILEIADLEAERRSMGISTAIFFAVYGALLLLAAYGLWRCSPWSRGPALITQLILLGIAWNVRDHLGAAIAIAVVAAIAIAGVVHPDSIKALAGEDA